MVYNNLQPVKIKGDYLMLEIKNIHKEYKVGDFSQTALCDVS